MDAGLNSFKKMTLRGKKTLEKGKSKNKGRACVGKIFNMHHLI